MVAVFKESITKVLKRIIQPLGSVERLARNILYVHRLREVKIIHSYLLGET